MTPRTRLLAVNHRQLSANFQRRVAKDRLGLDADQIAGGHLVALSNPDGLAERLAGYLAELP